MSKEYKEHIEREDAKARLRIWLSDCVLDGAKMDKEEEYGCDFAKQMGFSTCDKCPIDCDIRQLPKEETNDKKQPEEAPGE